MELNAEARRILAVSISKLYASRSQRGGLRLHRSLLVSLVMKSARDIYHSTAALVERAAATAAASPSTEEAMEAMDTAEKREKQPEMITDNTEDKENQSPAAKRPRKRPGKVSAVPDFLPEKRARLEPGEERHEAAAQGQSLCRSSVVPETLSALPLLHHRVIPAF
ncbi:immediate early response 2b [Boleophthalmus pectinirostris]|uniref:immediate early response 2b n=1 Tax=Boleophthalmus pectinirostris TaxID=150288 RepID=UPI000A1C1B4C|nr:immediate early response 2b [Boleophthalmus pectinirostris]